MHILVIDGMHDMHFHSEQCDGQPGFVQLPVL
jgi:hypothetical protein